MDDGGYLIRLVVAALATWRVTHLLAHEDGPWDVVVRVRERLGRSLAGSLMDCFNGLSLWIAAAAAFYVSKGRVAWVFDWLRCRARPACCSEWCANRRALLQRTSLHRSLFRKS